jgi:hypothetical protein
MVEMTSGIRKLEQSIQNFHDKDKEERRKGIFPT